MYFGKICLRRLWKFCGGGIVGKVGWGVNVNIGDVAVGFGFNRLGTGEGVG